MDSGAPAFRELPRAARWYVPAVLIAATVALTADILLTEAPELDPLLLVVVGGLCAGASLYEVLAPGHYSFQPNLAFFFWGCMLLPSWAIALVAAACFLPRLILRRERWYLAAFNIADYVLAGLAASALVELVAGVPIVLSGGRAAATLLAGALVLVVVNHVLIAVAAAFSRGQSLASTLRAAGEGIPLDLSLVMTGACVAFLWSHSPYLALLAAGRCS